MPANRSTQPARAELIETLQKEAILIGDSIIRFHQSLGERMGLNPTEHKCADILFRSGPLTAGELAGYASLSTGAITGIIDRLEGAGYAQRERDPADRRKVIVRPLLDNEKEGLIEALMAPLTRSMGTLCASYNDRDLATILDFVRRYTVTMREEAARLKEGMPAP